MLKHDGNDYMRAGIAELEETEIPARHDWLWTKTSELLPTFQHRCN